MIRRPPRSTRTDTLFPYTTLFRSNYDLIIGGYYFQEKLHGGVAMPASNIYLPIFFGVPIAQEYLTQGYFAGSNLDTRAFAAFGQLTYRVSDQLSATVGARYSIERKTAINQIGKASCRERVCQYE